jgi:hypothetical protein
MASSLDLNRVAVVCNTHKPDLYAISREFYKDLPIRQLTVDGRSGLYSLDFLDHVIRTLLDVDWMISVDEDFFLTDQQVVMDLLEYQVANQIGFCGVPDGGVIDHRFHNPVAINPFFTIMDLGRLRVSYEQFGLQSRWTDDLKIWTPEKLIRPEYRLSYDEFEPYYQLFFWALRQGIKPLYLDARSAKKLDPYTTVIRDHQGREFGYHTWFSRLWHEPDHRNRILRVADHCRQIARPIV